MKATERLEATTGKLTYVKNILSIGGLQEWEAKEYADLANLYENEISELTDYIKSNGL